MTGLRGTGPTGPEAEVAAAPGEDALARPDAAATGADPGSGPGTDPGADPNELAGRIGFSFSDPDLLLRALSHRSWCAESGGQPSNERLEFLGDAVLGLVVAEHCYRTYPSLPEGALAKVRAAVVNTAVLAEVAGELGLGAFLRLGRGEDASGGRRKASILANAVEAVIGAVYLDGGWPDATRLVLDLLGTRIADAAAGPGAEDFKTRLQELVLRLVAELPRYEVEGAGPDHARRYTASVAVADEVVGRGEGRSKKDAEQAAARAAWRVLVPRPGADGDLRGADGEVGVRGRSPGDGGAQERGGTGGHA
jgi:ribonuclease-3